MYKNILIITLLFIVFSSRAQKKKDFRSTLNYPSHSVYIRPNSLKSGTTYQKLDSVINFSVNETMEEIPYLKETFDYNEKGNLNTQINYVWSKQNEKWINNYKWELTNNEFDQCTSFTFFWWDVKNTKWESDYKEDFNYNENGNITQITYFRQDPNANQWINDYKEEFSYDIANNSIQHLYFIWNSEIKDWCNDYKIDYEYNNKNLVKSNYYDTDTAGNWINDYLIENLYNDVNLITQTIYSDWDTLNDEWKDDFLGEFNYDSLLNLIQNIYKKADVSEVWVNESKEDFFYNDSNYLVQHIDYQWNSLTNQWANKTKKEYTYPYNTDQEHLVLPYFFYENDGKPDIDVLASSVSYNGDSESETWLKTEKRILYFSDFDDVTISVSENDFNQLKIYPNPVSEILHIESSYDFDNTVFELYNSSGNLVYKNANTQNIHVSQYPGGVYFLKILKHGKKLTTTKIIIE